MYVVTGAVSCRTTIILSILYTIIISIIVECNEGAWMLDGR